MKNKKNISKLPVIEASRVSIAMGEDRYLIKDLNMSVSQERIALIGRNGVGKSTLLEVLSGNASANSGNVLLRVKPFFVRQSLDPSPESVDVTETLHWLRNASISQKVLAKELVEAGLPPLSRLLSVRGLSHGELRKLRLLAGKLSSSELLLLDEPTEDLDEFGIHWLLSWLGRWEGSLLVASHNSNLLRQFENFFIVSESGCRCFSGTFSEFQEEMDEEYIASQKRYLRNINRMVKCEEHIEHIARRRRRKKQYGRVRELGRATPRVRLNQKRDYAQVKHGRMKKKREVKRLAVREWTKATRRSLHVNLPMELHMPDLPPFDGRSMIQLENVAAQVGERCLFNDISYCNMRSRLAVIGPNGAGKTTLLNIMLGWRAPDRGVASRDSLRIGSIAQRGGDWLLEESLMSYLRLCSAKDSPEAFAEILIAHKFPLSLGRRPMRSLSPGERVRAALICLFQRSPVVELLVLDEPTYSLDLPGQRALCEALSIWPGGLVVASHDKAFLASIGIDEGVLVGG